MLGQHSVAPFAVREAKRIACKTDRFPELASQEASECRCFFARYIRGPAADQQYAMGNVDPSDWHEQQRRHAAGENEILRVAGGPLRRRQERWMGAMRRLRDSFGASKQSGGSFAFVLAKPDLASKSQALIAVEQVQRALRDTRNVEARPQSVQKRPSNRVLFTRHRVRRPRE